MVTENSFQKPNEKLGFTGIIKKVFFLYKKGFWKFWLVYLVSFLVIKGVMLGFYWSFNWLQDNTFIGFSLAQSNYYVQYQDLRTISTLDPFISDETFITKSFLIYFGFEILYQALLAIPLAISILIAKNIFDRGNDSLKKQSRDVFLLLGPLLMVGVITNFLVRASTYFWYFPGLIVMALTSMVYPIALEEKLRPIATIKRSFQLAKEQFFNILGIVLIIVAVQLVVLGIGKAFAALLVYSPNTADRVLSVYDSIYVLYQYDVVQSIVYSLVAPFTAITAFVIYKEAITIRTLKLSSAVDATTRIAKSSTLAKSTLSVNTQMNKAVLTETKSMIRGLFCGNCGHKNDADAKFCDSCGNVI